MAPTDAHFVRERDAVSRVPPLPPRLILAALLVAICASLSLSLAALELRVRATPRFADVKTSAHPAGTKVVGSLLDENDQAVTSREVQLHAPNTHAQACESGSAAVQTDAEGRFCFILEGTVPDRAQLSFAGDDYYAPRSRQFAVDLSPSQLSLGIEVDATTWPLSSTAQQVTVTASSHAATDERHAVTLELLRNDEAEAVQIAHGHVSVNQPAEFTVVPSRLGAPGPATLVVSADATPTTRASSAIILVGHATLAWSGALQAVRPELGFELAISAISEHGELNSGWVEILVGDERVGSGPVRGGIARVSARFIAGQHEQVELRARYVAEHSWIRAGNDLHGVLPIARAPLWLHLPWIVVGALAAVWIFRAWWRPKRPRQSKAEQAPRKQPTPGAVVVTPGPPQTGWSGIVFDVHQRQAPIEAAELAITCPSVEGRATLASTLSDVEGRFSLGAVGALPEGSRLVVRSPHHTQLVLPVPPEGKITIAMVSRRRTILEHLHEWARAQSWDVPALVTPQRVANEARRRERPHTERWALRVQQGVFGPSPPDEELEADLTAPQPSIEVDPHKR